LPPSLLPRFIVEAHRNHSKKKTRWRTGVVLSTVGCHILVKGDIGKRRIDILVGGPDDQRRSALNVVLNDLDFVNKLNPESEPTAMFPLPDQPEVTVRYGHLLDLKNKKGLDFEFLPDGGKRDYTVRELLEGVERDTPQNYPEKEKPEAIKVAEITKDETITAAKIGAIGAIIVALIGSLFLYFTNSNKEPGPDLNKKPDQVKAQKALKNKK
jgi:hypothetical protein